MGRARDHEKRPAPMFAAQGTVCTRIGAGLTAARVAPRFPAMLRAIVGFHQDELGDWVAELRCGHGQHVRHQPPFQLRPWVQTPEGRAEKLGAELECVRCDRFELPEGFAPYKRTPEFDERSTPDGLRKNHTTKAGVWGVIHVLEGRLRYVIEGPRPIEQVLDPDHPGIVVPEVPHHVSPEGAVRFFVEFHRRPAS
jgi:tellurite methyltransferase